MKKISPAQAAALMLCFSLARLIAFRPEGAPLPVCAAAVLISDLLLTALFIILPEGFEAPRPVSKVFSAAAGIWLVLALTALLSETVSSLSYSFPDFYAPPAVTAAAAAAAAYCASMGLRGCGRAACAVFVFTAAVLCLTAAGAADSFDPERLDLAYPRLGEQFTDQLIRQLSRSAEFPLFILLREHIRCPRRAALLRFAGQSLTGTGLFTVCAGVLGERGMTGIPADTLSSFSKTSVIERFDALMLLVWTLCTLFAAAAILIGLRECLKRTDSWLSKLPAAVPAAVCAGIAMLVNGRALPAYTALSAAVPAAVMLLASVFKEKLTSGRNE